MIKEGLNHLGETLNGTSALDNLKRLGISIDGFLVSYKVLVEFSKPSGQLPPELVPLAAIPLVFFSEIQHQLYVLLFVRADKNVRSYFAEKFPKQAKLFERK